MTNKEILAKAIDKAIKNGWKLLEDSEGLNFSKIHFDISDYRVVWSVELFNKKVNLIESSIFGILFSPDFAKALFGHEPMFLVDDSPDWAHDTGDIELKWVTEDEYKMWIKRKKEDFFEKFPRYPQHLFDDDIFDNVLDESTAWIVRLQEMVIEDDPVKYLEEFI